MTSHTQENHRVEQYLLWGHLLSMAFGLAGLLLVVPNADFLAHLPAFGQTAFRWSMAGGGVFYMLLGTTAVALYAKRTLGNWHWLAFMVPAVGLSLTSELLGTSTGFPFGHYRYLSGLGYKIAGLVPFTIPLSWFYLGFCAYLLVRAGLNRWRLPTWGVELGAILVGAILLMSWDFVLDPAMSQTTIPFWVWEQPGAFFGMPYENFLGWFGTGVVFMTVATFLWRRKPLFMPMARDLNLPLTIYLGNFLFATVMSVGAGFYVPIALGCLTGAFPAIAFYLLAQRTSVQQLEKVLEKETMELV